MSPKKRALIKGFLNHIKVNIDEIVELRLGHLNPMMLEEVVGLKNIHGVMFASMIMGLQIGADLSNHETDVDSFLSDMMKFMKQEIKKSKNKKDSSDS